ncbi:caprin-1-like [Argiope bruennichi]|uniref:caprin-1-like n=1 Tax=Argiope bruennichi TaxID=94029 RepID=UPI0024948E0F|nr:caprin-1-like [Argiope bruennichi]
MPSASAKVEKIAPVEAIDPMKICLQTLEKRMRNLEKRKIKLDNYRNDVKNGKELNEDQKLAVSKYDSVICVLEFAGDLYKSMNTTIQECSRQLKKQAKKEQLERQQHEIQRLQEAFIFCHILSCFQNEDVRSDFLNGENGAIQLTSEQLSQLDQLYKLLGPALPNERADLTNHFHALAENHIFLVEGKNKEIAGTTYKVLKDLLSSIKESGYFSRPSEPLEDGTSSDDMQEENLVEKLENTNISSEQQEIIQTQTNDQQYEASGESNGTCAVTAEEIHESPAPVQNGPLQEVLSSQNAFNFLQESQIDMGAPHMDPAVVAVHQMAPPQAVNYAMTPYPPTSPHEETPPLVNGNEPHEIPGPSVPASQVSPIPNAIPRTVPPVLTSVQHDFDPSHPIPTQTFTNQSFAVMQNMIMPQGYVPVTMHHGPLPHHIAPIAVVPAPPPVTTAPAPVIPMHVPVTVPVQDVSPLTASEPKPEIEETQPIMENNDIEPDSNSNEPSGEKGTETNGYPQYRGGYRGRGRGRGNNGYFRGRNNYHNGRGGYQNHYYQDRNGYNSNYRRGNNRGRGGNGNNRGRGNYRTQSSQQQQPQQQQQAQQ